MSQGTRNQLFDKLIAARQILDDPKASEFVKDLARETINVVSRILEEEYHF